MFMAKLTEWKMMDIYNRVNKKPTTLLSENKLSVIYYDQVNAPGVKKNNLFFQDKRNLISKKNS